MKSNIAINNLDQQSGSWAVGISADNDNIETQITTNEGAEAKAALDLNYATEMAGHIIQMCTLQNKPNELPQARLKHRWLVTRTNGNIAITVFDDAGAKKNATVDMSVKDATNMAGKLMECVIATQSRINGQNDNES